MSEGALQMSRPMPVNPAYRALPDTYDEMFEEDLSARPACEPIVADLLSASPERINELRARADRMFLRMGVTFNVYGDDAGTERIFPFDVVPRVIDAETWRHLEAGLAQRVRALNAFVADIYGEAKILKDEVVPRDLICGSPQYRRAAIGIKPPGGVFITVAGIDLVRGRDGTFMVLEDNARTPSGVSYVLENRLVMTRLMPDLVRKCGVRSVETYPSDLLASLMEIAPEGVSRPTAALLTPGPYNSAFFEHVFLSEQMGIELVEGHDLVCVDHKLFMKTVSGLEQVHVLYRRIDDDFLDPLVFRSDSLLGVAGITDAMRAGTVTVANGIGTGVADDKAVFAYTPDMIRYYLGEEPLLPIVETHLLRDPDVRKRVIRDLDQFVVKPTGASGGYGVLIGPKATYRELAQMRDAIEKDPASFIAQPMVQLSAHPTYVGQGSSIALVPRHVDLRPFVLLGSKARVLPGGLTRVALREGSMIVNSSQGGGSKDTWVVDD
jgi:uncharacterized circularly permuted ATP-grasp superfamily protein